MTYVGTQPTFVWLDHIGAIYGGSDNASGAGGTGRMSLAAQLQNAVSKGNGSTPEIAAEPRHQHERGQLRGGELQRHS